jgi:hypothetical protein
VAGALATQLEGSEDVSLDVVGAIRTGASASDVARAIPSSINSMHMIPLGGLSELAEKPGPRKRSAEAAGLRDILDTELQMTEPALETENPNQASALDIDLAVPEAPALPAWATRGGSSGRLSRVGPPARRPRRTRRRGGLVALVITCAAAIAAVLAFVLSR